MVESQNNFSRSYSVFMQVQLVTHLVQMRFCSLKNKDNLQRFKFPQYSYDKYAIYRNFKYGPTFGGGHDLYISDNANSNINSYTNLGRTYQPPPGYTYRAANTRALLAGTYHFSPSEVEVFHLQ